MGEPDAVPETVEEEAPGLQPVWVQFLGAKPNKMFSEEQRQVILFLRYSQAVPCAECGKRSKYHWSMLLSFQAHSMPPGVFTTVTSEKVHLPCAPVCRDHPLLAAPLPAGAGKRRRRG